AEVLQYGSHEPQSPALKSLDEPLHLPVVAENRAGGVDPGAQGGFRYDASLPYGGDKVVPADHARPVAYQIEKQVEDLRFDGNRSRSAKQLAAIRIEREFVNQVAHGLPTPASARRYLLRVHEVRCSGALGQRTRTESARSGLENEENREHTARTSESAL